MTLKLSEKDGAIRFEVHAKPRAKKSRIIGPRAEALEVALAAPPVEGAANDELIRILASTLGVPRRSVVIVRGETSQKKLVAVDGLAPDEILVRLTPADASGSGKSRPNEDPRAPSAPRAKGAKGI